MSSYLQPPESQHARLPCPSPSPRVHSNIESVMPSSHLILVVPFSSCPQSLPAAGSFPVSQLVAWGGQSIGVSALASFLPKNTQGWSPLEWTGWISLQSKASILQHSAFLTVQLSHPYMTTGKAIALTRRTFVSKCLCFWICYLGW